MQVGRWFVAGLWAFGVASALAVVAWPALRDFPVPSLAFPLGLALLLDIVLMPLSANGRVQPVTMNERALGVIGAALIHLLLLAAIDAA